MTASQSQNLRDDHSGEFGALTGDFFLSLYEASPGLPKGLIFPPGPLNFHGLSEKKAFVVTVMFPFS